MAEKHNDRMHWLRLVAPLIIALCSTCGLVVWLQNTVSIAAEPARGAPRAPLDHLLQAPSVPPLSLEPPRNAVTAPLTTTVSITYDEPISAATVTSHTFAVHGMQSGLVTATHSVVDGNTIVVTPTRPFHQGELVYAVATTRTLNITGTGPLTATQWQFNAGEVTNRCVAGFTEVYTGSLMGVNMSSVAWGDYDNDGDLDILLTGSDGSGPIAKMYQNTGSGFSEVYAGSLTGVSHSSIAWGDYDNDGDLDILLTGLENSSSYISKVYQNIGSGFSEVYTGSLTGVASGSAAWGDYDNDGDLDVLLTGHYYDGSNNYVSKVYQNTGSGFSEVYTGSLTGVTSGSVAWGDYDNDGVPDVLLTGFYWDGSNNYVAKVYRNTGSGFSEVYAGSLTGVEDGSVAWGDYDNDGDLDILLTGYYYDGSSIYVSKVYQNTGYGFSEVYTGSLTGVTSGSVAWGDYDNDGDLDILLTGYADAGRISRVYQNIGSSFTEVYAGSLRGVSQSNVVWGDYDNDGDLDILLTGSDGSAHHAKIYRNDDCPPRLIGIAPPRNAVTAALTTTVAATYDQLINPTTVTSRTFAVHAMQTGLLTQTHGVVGSTIILTPPHPFKSGELVQVSATTGTLNLRGEEPVSPTVWQFWIAAGSGSGVFADSGQDLGSAYSLAVALGDLDGDGDLDAFVAEGDQADTVWFNNGGVQGGAAGTFSDSGQSLGTPTNSTTVALGDVDNDGDLDACVGNQAGSRLWLNDGNGTFSDGGAILGSMSPDDIALGDVDGDGDLDAFVTQWGQPNRVWVNNGGIQGGTLGTFSDSGQNLGYSDSQGVALGDVDDDGDLDAFVTNSGEANKVWLNDGGVQGGTPGDFNDSGQSLGSSPSWSVALGDVDGDGDLDAFVGNSDQADKVWLNDGTGTFVDGGQSLGNSHSHSVALGDLDGDGDLDAFATNWSEPNKVWLNDGAGNFDDGNQSLRNSGSQGVMLGDVDGDGDLDAFITSGIYQANKVWLNRNRVDLATSKSAMPISVIPGQHVTYTLTYINAGPESTTGVVITDLVPVALTGVAYTYSGPPITPTGSVSYTWQVGALPAGASGIITVTGVVSPYLTADTVITNTATISTGDFDTDPSNNSASTVVTAILPTAGFNAASYSVVEGAEPATITVTLDFATPVTVTVNYTATDGTAVSGSDYTAGSAVLTFAPGTTAATFTLLIAADGLDEDNETVNLTLSDANYANLGTDDATLTILDDDALPTVQFSAPGYSVGEGVGTATITVTLNRASGRTVTVDYATSDGTAIAGSDYVASSGTLTFTPGTTVLTFTVPVIGDVIDETDETVDLSLSSANNAILGLGAAALTITDDDSAVLSLNDVTITEGDSGTVDAVFTATLSVESALTVSVDYATADGTATTTGGDYVAAGGTVVFPPGTTTQFVTIAVNGDVTDEANETFFVNLSNAGNAAIADGQGQATIVDDEPPLGSVIINDDEAYTPSPSVTLMLDASDVNGVASMRLANDGAAFGGWLPYTATRAWDLLDVDGTRVVRAQYRDGLGNVSPVYTDAIILDTTPPTAAVSYLTPYQAALTFTVSWAGSDPAPGSGQAAGIESFDVQVRDGNTAWTDWLTETTALSTTFEGLDGHTYYFRARARDALGNLGTYATGNGDAVTHVDSTRPEGSLAINGGALDTTSRDVVLVLTANGASQMAFSGDGVTFGGWEPFAATRAYQLPAGDGQKTVYVRYRDPAGNSSTYSDTITLNTAIPGDEGLSIDDDAPTTEQVTVTLTLKAPPGTQQMMVSNSSRFIAAEWEPYSATRTWVLAYHPNVTVYQVYARFRHVDGTVGERYDDIITLDLLEPPPPVDSIPPSGSMVINAGAGETSVPTVTLDVLAADNPGGLGVQWMYFREWKYDPLMVQWVIVRSSGWLPYTEDSTSWALASGTGVKYVGAWFADGANNVSNPVVLDSINLVLPGDTISETEVTQYRQTFEPGQQVTVTLEVASGDADLYIWRPDSTATPDYWSNLPGTATEQLVFTAIEGEYLIEVHGYASSQYTLDIATGEGGGGALGQREAAPQRTNALVTLASKPLPARPLVTTRPGDAPPSEEPWHYIHLPLVVHSYQQMLMAHTSRVSKPSGRYTYK